MPSHCFEEAEETCARSSSTFCIFATISSMERLKTRHPSECVRLFGAKPVLSIQRISIHFVSNPDFSLENTSRLPGPRIFKRALGIPNAVAKLDAIFSLREHIHQHKQPDHRTGGEKLPE